MMMGAHNLLRNLILFKRYGVSCQIYYEIVTFTAKLFRKVEFLFYSLRTDNFESHSPSYWTHPLISVTNLLYGLKTEEIEGSDTMKSDISIF